MSHLHARAVEAVAQARAQREGIEAEPPVEPGIRAAQRPPRCRWIGLAEVGRHRQPNAARTLPPRGSLFAGVEQEELQPVAEPLREARDDSGVEEEARREGIRQDEPGARHDAARAPSATVMRSAR